MKPLGAKLRLVTTISWLVDADLKVPDETRAAREKLLGPRSYEKWK
jgi:hypothetical protein